MVFNPENLYLPTQTNLSNSKNYNPQSDEEYFYAKWIKKLIDEGYIISASRPDTIRLVEQAGYDYSHLKKNKIVEKQVVISKAGSYTGDMDILWAQKAHGIFYIQDGDHVKYNLNRTSKTGKKHYFHHANEHGWSTVDVKGTGVNMKHHSSSSFDRIQQLVYLKTGMPLQKIVPFGPKGLFNTTFSPDEYFYTPKGKIKQPTTWKLTSFKEFIDDYENPILCKPPNLFS